MAAVDEQNSSIARVSFCADFTPFLLSSIRQAFASRLERKE